jgi:hypothetical protein
MAGQPVFRRDSLYIIYRHRGFWELEVPKMRDAEVVVYDPTLSFAYDTKVTVRPITDAAVDYLNLHYNNFEISCEDAEPVARIAATTPHCQHQYV